MRALRIVIAASGLLLLLTACSRGQTSQVGTAGSDSSVRLVTPVGRLSSRSFSSSSSSSRAPFFSLESFSASPVPPRGAASSIAVRKAASASSAWYSIPADIALGPVKVHVDSDRGEARAGDQLSYIVTAKNTSTQTLPPFQVAFSFVPAQLTILESDGSVEAGFVRWMVEDLQPGQKRALRLRAAVSSSLVHGERVTAAASILLHGKPEGQPSTFVVSIINRLPATGLTDGTSPLENTRRLLTPFWASGSPIPAAVWVATLLMGLALGGTVARKYL